MDCTLYLCHSIVPVSDATALATLALYPFSNPLRHAATLAVQKCLWDTRSHSLTPVAQLLAHPSVYHPWPHHQGSRIPHPLGQMSLDVSASEYSEWLPQPPLQKPPTQRLCLAHGSRGAPCCAHRCRALFSLPQNRCHQFWWSPTTRML